jgi:hypothetical protein
VILVRVRVDDEPDGLVRRHLPHQGHQFVDVLRQTAVDQQNAVVADGHGDVPAVADDHRHIALNRQHVQVVVGRHAAIQLVGLSLHPRQTDDGHSPDRDRHKRRAQHSGGTEPFAFH